MYKGMWIWAGSQKKGSTLQILFQGLNFSSFNIEKREFLIDTYFILRFVPIKMRHLQVIVKCTSYDAFATKANTINVMIQKNINTSISIILVCSNIRINNTIFFLNYYTPFTSTCFHLIIGFQFKPDRRVPADSRM